MLYSNLSSIRIDGPREGTGREACSILISSGLLRILLLCVDVRVKPVHQEHLGAVEVAGEGLVLRIVHPNLDGLVLLLADGTHGSGGVECLWVAVMEHGHVEVSILGRRLPVHERVGVASLIGDLI